MVTFQGLIEIAQHGFLCHTCQVLPRVGNDDGWWVPRVINKTLKTQRRLISYSIDPHNEERPNAADRMLNLRTRFSVFFFWLYWRKAIFLSGIGEFSNGLFSLDP